MKTLYAEMASNSNELLEYLNEHILECVICQGSLKQPKALPCLHVFCRDCIGPYINQNTNDGHFACPTCRENHILTKDGVNSLRDAFLQKSLMEVSNLVQKKPVPCTSCHSGNDAQSACPTCGDFFCSDCELSHKRLRLTKSHELTPIEELGDAKMLAKFQKTRYDMCRVHPTEVCKLYCENDDSEICTICTFDRKHKSHDVIAMEDKLQELQAEAAETKVKLDENIQALKEHKQFLTDIHANIKRQEENALQELLQRVTEIKQMLEKFNANLKEEIMQLSLKHQETAQEQLQQVETEIQEKEKLSHRFAVLDSLPVPSALNVASDIIQAGEEAFGRRSDEKMGDEFQDIKLVASTLAYECVESVLKSVIGFLSSSVRKDEAFTITHTTMTDEMKDTAVGIVQNAVWEKCHQERSKKAYSDIATLCAAKMKEKYRGNWNCLVASKRQYGLSHYSSSSSRLSLLICGLFVKLYETQS